MGGIQTYENLFGHESVEKKYSCRYFDPYRAKVDRKHMKNPLSITLYNSVFHLQQLVNKNVSMVDYFLLS